MIRPGFELDRKHYKAIGGPPSGFPDPVYVPHLGFVPARHKLS